MKGAKHKQKFQSDIDLIQKNRYFLGLTVVISGEEIGIVDGHLSILFDLKKKYLCITLVIKIAKSRSGEGVEAEGTTFS